MKIKRKLYPANNDKEFVLMSVNDLKEFGYDVLETDGGTPEGTVERCIESMLSESDLITPASHLKKTKQKTEESVKSDKSVVNFLQEGDSPF